MNNNKKINIIIFGMSNYTDWTSGIANRNYHVLQTLAKDERIGKIVAVDFLPIGFDWKRKVKYFYRNLIKGVDACDIEKKICIGGETMFGDLTSRCYQINSKVFVFSSIDNFNRVIDELVEVQKRLNLDNLIIWSYNPLIPNLKLIKEKLKAEKIVFDVVDDWSKHGAHKKRKTILEKNYKIIKKEFDLIFTVSKELKSELFDNQSNVHWVSNGVNVDHYDSCDKKNIPEELKNIKKPIIGYIGVIQDRFDLYLVKYLAEANRDKSFIFVGWLWSGLDDVINREFIDLENVHFLGRKSFNELPSYIHFFDVGIIPHKINELTRSMDPLKTYEYLACGKPVVSTNVSGLNEFGDFVKIAENKEEFNEYINEVLTNNSQELKEKRVGVAREHSWKKRVDKMIGFCVDKNN